MYAVVISVTRLSVYAPQTVLKMTHYPSL